MPPEPPVTSAVLPSSLTADPIRVGRHGLKLQVVLVPVSMWTGPCLLFRQAGFNLDHDVSPTEGMRVVQLTPRGRTARS